MRPLSEDRPPVAERHIQAARSRLVARRVLLEGGIRPPEFDLDPRRARQGETAVRVTLGVR